jgi:hypothetical protein
MPGEGRERFYAILNIGLLLGASFSLVAFSSIKKQYASKIEFPERGEALVYDPSVHHFDFRDAWNVLQRFVTTEPPPVTTSPVTDPPVTNDPPIKKQPEKGTKKEATPRTKPRRRDLPGPGIPGEPTSSDTPEPFDKSRQTASEEPAPPPVNLHPPASPPSSSALPSEEDRGRAKSASSMYWLSKLSEIQPDVMDGCGKLLGHDEYVRITFLGPPEVAFQFLSDKEHERGVRWQIKTRLQVHILSTYQNGRWNSQRSPWDHPFEVLLEENQSGIVATAIKSEWAEALKNLRACHCRLTPPIQPVF